MYLMNVSYFIRYCIIFSSYKFYRASNLRSIQLDSCIRISDEGLCEVAKKFPLLQEVYISNGFQSKKTLEVIGQSCPLLKSLTYYGMSYITWDDAAFVIAKTMPGLRHLDIHGNPHSDVGLIAILDGCPLLESLDIRGCHNLDFSGNLWKRLHNQIKGLVVRDPEYFNNFELEFAYSDSNGNSYWEIVERFSDDEAEDDDEDYGA
ncbi:putative F-box/LRR-repeat protein [Trifolium repens]|nr:putative F-box/LRR-repeat protein [Trifolium repens]